MVTACVNPQVPLTHAPAPDRYERAASQDPAARSSAADELVGDPTCQAVQMLETLLVRDVDPTVRAHAAGAIAERHDPELENMLERATMLDPDPNVRQAAARAQDSLWPWSKRPGTAAALSVLCPGCGQFYLRNYAKGAATLTAGAGFTIGGLALLAGEGVDLDGSSDTAKVPAGILLTSAGQNLWFYGIFDAYRDARVLRGDKGYKHHITRETLDELALAPFNPHVLKSPWVWGGVPAALAVGLGFSYLVSKGDYDSRPTIFDVDKVNVFGHRFDRGTGFLAGSGFFVGLFAPVGVGEEALFRGVIQTEMEERFGTIPGLVLGSVIFGSVHTFNFLQDDPKDALIAVPIITLVGSTLGLAYQHTGYQLKTSVAMHFWYDTLLSLAAFALDPQHQPFVVNYSMP